MAEQRERFEAWAISQMCGKFSWATDSDDLLSGFIPKDCEHWVYDADDVYDCYIGFQAAEAPLLERIETLKGQLSMYKAFYDAN